MLCKLRCQQAQLYDQGDNASDKGFTILQLAFCLIDVDVIKVVISGLVIRLICYLKLAIVVNLGSSQSRKEMSLESSKIPFDK